MPLLYVIWTVSLLTIIAVAAQSSGGLSYRLVRNTADAAQHDTFAEAALNRAILYLLDERDNEHFPVDGSAWTFNLNEIEVTVRIQDEQGRIDINHADASLLANLFRAADVPADKAQQLADGILDWRDSDKLIRLNGAEENEYHQAGLPYRPRNRPFLTIEELRLVLGMTPEIFQRVEPALTVYSGKATIDPRFAPPLAMRAFFGENVAQAADRPGIASQSGNRPVTRLRPGGAYRIQIEFSRKSVPVIREAVVRFRSGQGHPYWLLNWR
jgi:general secretion pathway protein K